MRALLHNRKAVVGLLLLATFLALALFGPMLVGDPYDFVSRPLEPPSAEHWLGTTGQGQDVLWQTVAGARPTLLVGFGVGAIVVVLGALVGTAAGYFGGPVGALLHLLINIFLVIPGLPLMVCIAAYLPAGVGTMAFVLAVTGWAYCARVFRAQTLALRSRDFVAAAQVMGESHVRIIVSEILPNMTSPLVSAFIGASLYALGAEVGLEFLGLGELGRVSWGTSLYWARNDAALLTGSWWAFVPAGACVGLVGFALALCNTAVDEIGNPRLYLGRAFRRATGVVREGVATPVVRTAAGERPRD
jgi:peptide/nickel transport system permease protein